MYTTEQALHRLVTGNDIFIKSSQNPADIGRMRRMETSQNGQKPYAAIVTCSDSRVPPEHLFSAGIGEIFVVRTAGNVIGNFELGSIEYAIQQFHVPLVLVMGHTQCGAVQAALSGYAEGYIADVINEIQCGLDGAETEDQAIYHNILHSKQRILQSEIVNRFLSAGKIMVACAKYDIYTGRVDFFRGED